MPEVMVHLPCPLATGARVVDPYPAPIENLKFSRCLHHRLRLDVILRVKALREPPNDILQAMRRGFNLPFPRQQACKVKAGPQFPRGEREEERRWIDGF